MFRGIYYGSAKNPREMIWIVGMVIYLMMMAAGFMGYVLPWGQMSIWGAIVITNLFSAIPPEEAGTAVTQWLWGGFAVDGPTLNRFFSLHYLVPFLIVAMVALHVWALHIPSNNNPTGISIKTKADTLDIHPYFTVKDAFAIVVFLMIFAWFMFFMPDSMGHPDNLIPANSMSTPAHIVPEWYYLPFYAMLRAVPDKLLGVLTMFGAIGILFVLPWLDTSKVRSMRYRPLAKQFFFIFVIACLGLGWCGAKLPSDLVFATGVNAEGHAVGFTFVWLSRILTLYYFAFFIVILPVLGWIEKPKPRPASIEASVLGHAKGDA
jgi:ubiquinol-cytochrome c reductase cytochrome b subunit